MAPPTRIFRIFVSSTFPSTANRWFALRAGSDRRQIITRCRSGVPAPAGTACSTHPVRKGE